MLRYQVERNWLHGKRTRDYEGILMYVMSILKKTSTRTTIVLLLLPLVPLVPLVLLVLMLVMGKGMKWMGLVLTVMQRLMCFLRDDSTDRLACFFTNHIHLSIGFPRGFLILLPPLVPLTLAIAGHETHTSPC